jgi:predicted nucleic-acid-binding protein
VIGLDTNVVVRYLVQDEPVQSQLATSLIESLSEAEPGFVSIVTMAELSWVLNRAYGVDRTAMADIFDGLLSSRELVLQHADAVREGVVRLRDGADFADTVITDLGRGSGCHRTMTFDERAAQRAGMTLLDESVS